MIFEVAIGIILAVVVLGAIGPAIAIVGWVWEEFWTGLGLTLRFLWRLGELGFERLFRTIFAPSPRRVSKIVSK